MPNFIINRDSQENGNYEIHNAKTGCHSLPAEENQVDLGWHEDCNGAVRYAQELYPEVKDRIICCTRCNAE